MSILVIWTLVGFAGTQMSLHEKYDWRPIGEFTSPISCQNAAKQLGISVDRFRCLNKT